MGVTRILDVVNPRVVYLVTMESCKHRLLKEISKNSLLSYNIRLRSATSRLRSFQSPALLSMDVHVVYSQVTH